MNVLLLLAAVFALFIVVDILTAKLLKKKRTLLRNISLAALCVLTVVSGVSGLLSIHRNADTTTKTLYNAYSYLLEGNIDKASENAEKVHSPHSDIITLLTYCWRDNYASAFIGADDLKIGSTLNNDLTAQVDKVYNLSRKMIGLEGTPVTDTEAHEQLNDIAKDCFALLQLSEKSEVVFLSGFKRDRMLNSDNYYEIDHQLIRKMLDETPNDKELLHYSIKYFNAMGSLDMAEENAKRLLDTNKTVDNIVMYTDVIAQKLLNDISITYYDESDKEITALLQKAEESEKAADNYDEDNPRRDENLAKAEDYRKQANGVKAKRIINWLIAQSPLFGDQSGIIDLQLSKLYTASGNDVKARGLLLSLMKRADRLNDSSSLKNGLVNLNRIYYNTSASDDDIATAINMLLQNDAFLIDSVLNRDYSQFLNNFLKYERVSIFISRVNADNYPTVRAYLNVNGKKDGIEELANDFVVNDFTFVDNGFFIPVKDVKRIEDDSNNFVSIALVVDGSGSMDGSPVENAKKAVLACIRNMRPETQEISIVRYDNSAAILSPLTNDARALEQSVSQVYSGGGTNISSGLLAGLETLENAAGVKAVILMTDGQDGSRELMENAIIAAQEANVAVFTVGLGDADRDYMENIARQTGGSYMEAMSESELVNIYTALQNYIVNNYCFEFTVTQDVDSNPRLLTIGLSDYEVSSSRTYAYGGLIITKDGSFITRGDSSSLRLLYAEPSVVSQKDVELGVPVFISATGVTDGASVFVNGMEVKNVKTVGDSVITFILSGKHNPGALNINIRLKDGTSRSTDRLITVAGITNAGFTGQTIILGGGNTLYADSIEQKDARTLKLSGNIVLNGLIRTTSNVTVQSNSPITSRAGRLSISNGTINGSGASYVDFSNAKGNSANYGQLTFGGGNVKVLDSFSFSFDEYTINSQNSGVTLQLPGFGDIYADVRFDGSELTLTASGGNTLSDLQANLNYTLNGIPLPQNRISNAIQMITGYSLQNQYGGYNNYGITANVDVITVTIRKDFMHVMGTGNINGTLGPIDIADGKIAIDTDNIGSMFEITGTARFNNFSPVLAIDGQTPFTIKSVGYYPDSLTLKATGLTIDVSGISECFTDNLPPKALDGSISVNYPLSIINEPYKGQLGGWLSDVSLVCDKIEFICSEDRNKNSIRAYSTTDPSRYVEIVSGGIVIPIFNTDELSLFGSNLGGEISGTATISDRQIELNIAIDGHFDNSYYGIKHDGRANLNVTMQRNAGTGNTFPVTIVYDEKTLTYTATAIGNIIPQDGFNTYGEDYGQ